MNFTDVKTSLQNLITDKSTKINWTTIGEALGVDRSTICTRAKRKTDLKVEEVKKIEKRFNVSLLEDVKQNTNSDLARLKVNYNISEEDLEFINVLLTNKTKRSMAKMFFEALDGNQDAQEMIKMIICSPMLASEFSPSDPKSILNKGHKIEEEQFQDVINEAQND